MSPTILASHDNKNKIIGIKWLLCPGMWASVACVLQSGCAVFWNSFSNNKNVVESQVRLRLQWMWVCSRTAASVTQNMSGLTSDQCPWSNALIKIWNLAPRHCTAGAHHRHVIKILFSILFSSRKCEQCTWLCCIVLMTSWNADGK